MDPVTIAAIVTSVCSVIAAVAAAFGSIKRNEFEALERRVDALEADLKEERDAHAGTRKTLRDGQESYNALHEKYLRALAALARYGIPETEYK